MARFKPRYSLKSLLVFMLVAAPLLALVGDFVLPLEEERPEQKIYSTEELRQIMDDWEKFWELDQPEAQEPLRVHGGLI